MGEHGVVFSLGPLAVTSTVVTTWALMLLLSLGSLAATRRLSVDSPGLLQSALEGAVQGTFGDELWAELVTSR